MASQTVSLARGSSRHARGVHWQGSRFRTPEPGDDVFPPGNTYLDARNALHDAMFADGNRQLLDTLASVDVPLANHAPTRAVLVMNAAGVTEADDVDCLIEARLNNGPGGDRRLRRPDRITDRLVDDATNRKERERRDA